MASNSVCCAIVGEERVIFTAKFPRYQRLSVRLFVVRATCVCVTFGKRNQSGEGLPHFLRLEPLLCVKLYSTAVKV